MAIATSRGWTVCFYIEPTLLSFRACWVNNQHSSSLLMFISKVLQSVLSILPLTVPLSPVLESPGYTTSNVLGPSLIVDLGYAKYLGQFTPPFAIAHLGIPYAEPPIGDRRFRDPVPLDTDKLKQNSSVIDARNYTAPCVQGALSLGNVNQAGGMGSEDCLTMNIYTPVNATSTSKCE